MNIWIINSKNYWPAYTAPQPDELFTSWIYRVATEHYYKTYSFSKYYFTKPLDLGEDLDCNISDDIISTVTNHTILKPKHVQKMFLIPENWSAYSMRSGIFGNIHSILSLSFKSKKRSEGIMCCPSCLKKENIPYYK
ncbi:MAG: hypothetical protein EX285_08050, partial [Thaumarchaeota archaeon]|nr:hypothetical protein [Nitrososphaerota archaeon]